MKSIRLNDRLRNEILANVMADYKPQKNIDKTKKKIVKFAERMRQKMLKEAPKETPEFSTVEELEAVLDEANKKVVDVYHSPLVKGSGGLELQTNDHITIWPQPNEQGHRNANERIRFTYDGIDVTNTWVPHASPDRVGIYCTQKINWSAADYKRAKQLSGEYHAAENERGSYRMKVWHMLASLNTTKQLLELFPEFEKYLPEQEKSTLPAVNRDEILSQLRV